MFQLSYILPRDNNVEKGTLPAGAYKVTVSGLNGTQVLAEGWNGSAWVSLGTKTKANSGKLGFLSVTVPASGRIRFSVSGLTQPGQCKVRVSK
jgi:hypothetical protein